MTQGDTARGPCRDELGLRNKEASSSVPGGALHVGWRLMPTGRTGQRGGTSRGSGQKTSGAGAWKRAFEDGRAGSPGFGCACREDRSWRLDVGRGGKLGNHRGFSRRPGSWLSPPNKCVHRFLGEPAARKVYLFSILNLEATSQCASLQTSHPNYRWWRRVSTRGSTGQALSVASRGGRLPSSAQAHQSREL